MRAIINSKRDLPESFQDASPLSSVGSCSNVSYYSAADDERCFLQGAMLLGMDGRPVCVKELRQHHCILYHMFFLFLSPFPSLPSEPFPFDLQYLARCPFFPQL